MLILFSGITVEYTKKEAYSFSFRNILLKNQKNNQNCQKRVRKPKRAYLLTVKNCVDITKTALHTGESVWFFLVYSYVGREPR